MTALRVSPGRAMVAMLLVATVIACGGHDAGGAADAAADVSLAPGVAFMQGTIKCCDTGLGQSCCSAQEKDVGECAEFLGCTPAGDGLTSKQVCTKCCDGLGAIPRTKLVSGKCVDDVFPGAGSLCAACGDGTCNASAGENPCNCPADCGSR